MKLKRRALITLGGDRVARRPYRFRRNLTSAIDECTKKTIQATSSTNMTPIIIRGHTRWTRRGIRCGAARGGGSDVGVRGRGSEVGIRWLTYGPRGLPVNVRVLLKRGGSVLK